MDSSSAKQITNIELANNLNSKESKKNKKRGLNSRKDDWRKLFGDEMNKSLFTELDLDFSPNKLTNIRREAAKNLKTTLRDMQK